jgi:hypothetical protein
MIGDLERTASLIAVAPSVFEETGSIPDPTTE